MTTTTWGQCGVGKGVGDHHSWWRGAILDGVAVHGATLGDVELLILYVVAAVIFHVPAAVNYPEHDNWPTFFIIDIVNSKLNGLVWMKFG